MIRIAAEALLAAIAAQTHERGPPPKVYRDDGDLRDVQIIGQVDILAAMGSALAAMRTASDAMEEAGSGYVDRSQHIAVDGIWTVMMDAAIDPDAAG